ncbi:MAG: UbiA family prenyltransferase [bacterium]
MKIQNFISFIEHSRLRHCIFAIISWIFLRIFFEGILEIFHAIGYSKFSYRVLLMYFVHFPLFYLFTFLLVTILLSVILREDLIRVTKIASIGFGLIILIPVIDHLICGGCFISYPSNLQRYFLHFLNPFVSLTDVGISIGQRVVIVVICLFAAIYGYLKTAKIVKAIAIFFIILLAILSSGGITTMIACNKPADFFLIGGILKTDTQKFSAIYALFFIIIFLMYLFILNKKDFQLLTSSMRIERMVFYGGLGVAGFVLANHQSKILDHNDLFNSLAIIIIFLCPCLGFWALQILNDFFDAEADVISRPRNPIVRGIKKSYYSLAGLFLFLIVLILSAILNYQAFLIMLSFLLLGVLYSVPPVRLKRLPLVSTFILSLAVLLSIGLGHSVVYYEKALNQMPSLLIYAVLLGVTFGFTAKDLNDAESDKQNGIITFPVLFYRSDTMMGRLPLSAIISLGFVFFAVFIPGVFVGAILCSLVIFFYTLLSKKPAEWFYFFMLFVFSIYLLLTYINPIPPSP